MTDVQQDKRSYTGGAKALHWLVVALLIVQFGVAWNMPEIGRDTVVGNLVAWHLSFGAAILLAMLARLGWRATDSVPPPPSDLARPLQILSRATHYGFYVVLIILPLLGWANASARGWPVDLFGAIPLPALVQNGSPLGRQLGDVHKTLATALLALVALHVLGAFYHAVVLRDGILRRILPSRRP